MVGWVAKPEKLASHEDTQLLQALLIPSTSELTAVKLPKVLMLVSVVHSCCGSPAFQMLCPAEARTP